jgi:hypothetical protein
MSTQIRPRSELHSTDALFQDALSAPLDLAEAEQLPVLKWVDIQRPGTERFHSASEALGDGLKTAGIILLDLSGLRLQQVPKADLAQILTGDFVETISGQIFSDHRRLLPHFRELPEQEAEIGFYSFALNSRAGGVRGRNTGELHDGLPHSLIWNHSATTNPRVPGLELPQDKLDQVVLVYQAVLEAVVDSLAAYFRDQSARFRKVVGRVHRSNHIKMIHSPAAATQSPPKVSLDVGRIVRHRTHIDHCVLTLNPPTTPVSENGARFCYLSRTRDARVWRPLFVPPQHVAVFAGVDLHTFTKGSSHEIGGLPHQVLATSVQSGLSRSSLLYRLTVDPDSSSLESLSGHSFSFHGAQTRTGADYYRALLAHRRGY